MSTGYGWESSRQVCAMLLGARHVPERLCGGLSVLYWGDHGDRLAVTFLTLTTIRQQSSLYQL